MDEKRSFSQKLEAFFAGKGFYIALSLCVVVIGVSAFILFSGSGADVENEVMEIPEERQVYEPAAPEILEAEPEPEPALEEVTATEETGAWTAPAGEIPETVQYVWPVAGEVTLPYSAAALVYNEKMGDWRTSEGIEISVPLGTQVLSVAAGQVESVSPDDMGGMTVVILHAGGLRSVYSNLAAVPTVYEGDNVMTGEVIGSVGATAPGETKDDPHLCFSMTLDGVSVDPNDYLA